MWVEARGLTRRFGDLVALHDVSFALPPGRRTALVGPNGSGKSTLNRVLLGLLAYEGEVRIDGRSPLADRVATVRQLAYVPQIAPQLGAPVGELVRAVARLRNIEGAGVEKVAQRLDLDLAAVVRRPFRSLSGGMKQKLLIALALASRARLYVLDEPTGSLDARSRERFFPLFDELPEDTGVILCSHRLEEVRQLVDHVLLLEEGRLRYDGPASRFLASSTTSVIEVLAEGEGAAAWLAEKRFRPGVGAWWVRTLSHTEKTELVPELVRALGPRLRDLVVRDLETLELEAPGRRDA